MLQQILGNACCTKHVNKYAIINKLCIGILFRVKYCVCGCVSLFRHSNRGLIKKGTIGSPVGKRPPFAKRVQNIWEVLRKCINKREYKQKRNNGRTPFAGVYTVVYVCVCVCAHYANFRKVNCESWFVNLLTAGSFDVFHRSVYIPFVHILF